MEGLWEAMRAIKMQFTADMTLSEDEAKKKVR